MASVALNHVDHVFSFASYVEINGARFASREEGPSGRGSSFLGPLKETNLGVASANF